MGVTLCHLQQSEVTDCHGEVTESHLVGDSVSCDPNSVPNNTPESTTTSLNYSEIEATYNKLLPRASEIAKLTDTRKKLIKKFFVDFDMNMVKFEKYLTFLDSNSSFDWLFECRVMTDGTGRSWQPKKMEYFFSEKCYLAAKEYRGNNQ